MLAARASNLNGQADRAFTLTDLVTVLALVLVLFVVQLRSGATTRGKAQSASCLYNHRQMARAWQLYAQENNGRLVGNLDGGSGASSVGNSNKTWVLGWLDFTGGLPFGANTNTLLLTDYSPLATYLGRRAEVFKCPADTSLSRGTKGLPRVRSLSMNSYMGDRGVFGSAPDAGAYTPGYRQFRKLSEIINPGPSRAFVFIDEREDSINDGWFAIGMGGFDPPQPNDYSIIDYPADWHNRAVNLSFADDHTETWRWLDWRTMPRHGLGRQLALGVLSPNNPDVARIQAAASSRITPSQ